MEQPQSFGGSQAAADAAGNTQPSSAHLVLSTKASDHLANERTFLAWVRTGLAPITFGFVVERLPPLRLWRVVRPSKALSPGRLFLPSWGPV
jgi:uncharacterized membrane protein YidH (DUF202 family)